MAKVTRRGALGVMGAAAVAPTVARAGASGTGGAQWHVSTANAPWQAMAVPALAPMPKAMFATDASILIDKPRQTIAGFGGAFSELGWDALSVLAPAQRQAALAMLFSDDGAGFTQCRTPMGASDFARGWYSYDETPEDFALAHFSVERDRTGLIPYIKAAQAIRPDLQLWASPWSPPTWMKKGGHYAQSPAWPGAPDNGIRPDQIGSEGTDSFKLDEAHLDAYARYFGRYVAAYAREGIRIGTVMPQNEFNSAQPYPACCWTPQGLARFIPMLAREMDKQGVRVFFGTLERNNPALFEAVMADPKVASVIKGIGVQWAGKGTLPILRHRFPDIDIWGTEQECGTGTNDWHYARYGWATLKRYFEAGASTWTYWNMALPTGGYSTWGWPQNSLIVVDPATKSWRVTQDYWLMRHLSGAVRPGARAVPVDSFLGFEDHLAFRNPDGSLVLIANNGLGQVQQVRYALNGKVLALDLPADSLSTLVLPAGTY